MHIPIQNPSDDKNRWAETVSNNLPTESASSSSLNNKVFEDILYEVSIVQLAPKVITESFNKILIVFKAR